VATRSRSDVVRWRASLVAVPTALLLTACAAGSSDPPATAPTAERDDGVEEGGTDVGDIEERIVEDVTVEVRAAPGASSPEPSVDVTVEVRNQRDTAVVIVQPTMVTFRTDEDGTLHARATAEELLGAPVGDTEEAGDAPPTVPGLRIAPGEVSSTALGDVTLGDRPSALVVCLEVQDVRSVGETGERLAISQHAPGGTLTVACGRAELDG
jgi:hypothetical protein